VVALGQKGGDRAADVVWLADSAQRLEVSGGTLL
jgi:hypothetical protein